MAMNASSPPPAQPVLSRAAARNYALLNQLATPGLGSLLARRWIAGAGQLLLALAGFAMLIGWYIRFLAHAYGELTFEPIAPAPPWLGELGLAAFAAAWLWSLLTSLSLVRDARATEQARPETGQNAKPPVL